MVPGPILLFPPARYRLQRHLIPDTPMILICVDIAFPQRTRQLQMSRKVYHPRPPTKKQTESFISRKHLLNGTLAPSALLDGPQKADWDWLDTWKVSGSNVRKCKRPRQSLEEGGKLGLPSEKAKICLYGSPMKRERRLAVWKMTLLLGFLH